MSPHDFLLYLRNRRPWAARLFDGIKSLGMEGGTLTARIDTAAWPGDEMLARAGEIDALTKMFFGPGAGFATIDTKAAPETLPFPVASTKYWNHVGFIHATEGGAVALWGTRKTEYARMVRGEEPAESPAVLLCTPPPGEPGGSLMAALPDLLNHMAGEARAHSSYFQPLLRFPGHARADELEGRYNSIKEWGTPETPPAILQKFTGRIHYLGTRAAVLGFRLAEEVACGRQTTAGTHIPPSRGENG